MATSRATYRLINQLFDPLCMPSGAVRDVERDNVVRACFEYIIRTIGLQVTLILLLVAISRVESRPITDLSPLIEIRFASMGIIETFQHNEPGESLDTDDRTFENLMEVSELEVGWRK